MSEKLISQRFDKALSHKGIKGKDITDGFGVSSGTVSGWRNGARQPSIHVLEWLENTYNLSSRWIATGNGPMYIDVKDESDNKVIKYLEERNDKLVLENNRLIELLKLNGIRH